jgi:hypothetical protein
MALGRRRTNAFTCAKTFSRGQAAWSGDRTGETQERPISGVSGFFEFLANNPAARHTRPAGGLNEPFRQIVGKPESN